MSYSYATAKAILSDVEKDRILAMYLSSDTNDIDWDKATQAYGAASVDSMRVSYRNLLKKIEKAGGKTGVTAPFTGADDSSPSTPKTPKTPRGKGSRPPKRKAQDAGSDEDEDAPNTLRKKAAKNMVKAQGEDEDEDESAPKSVRKKATKSITRADDEGEDDDETIKTPKKAGRPRKTPVKSATKTAMSKNVDDDDDEEDATDKLDVASDKVEATQEEDGQTSEMIKEEDQSD